MFHSFFTLCFLFTSLIWYGAANVHGGTFLAMAGKDSVVLVSDSRFSTQKSGPMLLGKHPRQVIRIGSKCLIGCFGLDNDARLLLHGTRRKLLGLGPRDNIGPKSIARITSNLLYENRLVLSPVIAGLDSQDRPYICTMDGLGAQTESNKFAVVGTGSEGLMALCESLYVPNLEAASLLNLAEHIFSLAMQRDVMSGCNVRVFTITKDAIHMKDKERLDV